MAEPIHIECWKLLRGHAEDPDTGTTFRCLFVVPVERRDSTDCVLCKYGVCEMRMRGVPGGVTRPMLIHGRGATA